MGTELKMDAPTASPVRIADTLDRLSDESASARILWTALTALAATSLLGVAALVFFGFITFLSWSYPILLPIGLAVIIALVLEPIVGFVQKRGLKRGTATLLVCILAVIGFLLFWAFLLPPLVDQAGGLPSNQPLLGSHGSTTASISWKPA